MENFRLNRVISSVFSYNAFCKEEKSFYSWERMYKIDRKQIQIERLSPGPANAIPRYKVDFI